MNPERPPTEFEKKVYDALPLIPQRKVTTYGLLGKYISCRSALAIGQALRRNPFAPDTPFHRVVEGDLTIWGFAGQNDGEPIDRKRRLLENEGIRYIRDRSIDPDGC
jgi:methylated-DNA-[protein]-cysteine S-methyltransferase